MSASSDVFTVGTLKRAVINSTGSTVTLIAAVAGKRIQIHRLLLTLSAASPVTFRSTGGTALSGPMDATTFTLDSQSDPWFASEVGEGIELALGTSVGVAGVVWYTDTQGN